MKWCPKNSLLVCTFSRCEPECQSWTCPRCETAHMPNVVQCRCTTPEALSEGEGRVAIVGDASC